MIIASIFILVMSAVAWYKKPYVTICLILFFLPHQFLLKKIFDNQFASGDLFSVWKEILVIILLIKTFGDRQNLLPKIQSQIILFIILALIFYVITENHITSLAYLRNYTFPAICFIIIANHRFTVESKWIIRSTIFSSLIAVALGFIQQYLLSIPFSIYKGTIDFVDDEGYVQYINTSFRIMGIERMSGAFSGPNDFGVYMALVFVFSVVIFSSSNKNSFSKIFNALVILNLIGTFACLVLSFSRAGWFIATASLSIIFIVQIKNKIQSAFGLFFTTLLVLAIATALVPDTIIKAGEVLINSISMKEASAADRGNQFWKGVEKTIVEPLGHGVGTSDLRYKESLGFFVESGWWNIGYELGLLGLFLFLLINVNILLKTIKYKQISKRYGVLFPFDSYAIAIMVSTLITGFISINVVGTTYIYYYWIFMGLAFKNISDSNVIDNYNEKRKSSIPHSHVELEYSK